MNNEQKISCTSNTNFKAFKIETEKTDATGDLKELHAVNEQKVNKCQVKKKYNSHSHIFSMNPATKTSVNNYQNASDNHDEEDQLRKFLRMS